MLKKSLKLSHNIKKLIFSDNCTICSKKVEAENEYVCEKCYEKLKKTSSLKSVGNIFYIYHYDDDLKRLITDYKLANRKGLSKVIAKLIRKYLYEIIDLKEIDIIIPVPISNERMSERGFNQVEELLNLLKLDYRTIKRVKNTEYMYSLKSSEERTKNLEKAFKLEKKLLNKNILIFDDIVTTGATVKTITEEINRGMSKEQENNVYIFTIALSRNLEIKMDGGKD